jgi:hypothetical protein
MISYRQEGILGCNLNLLNNKENADMKRMVVHSVFSFIYLHMVSFGYCQQLEVQKSPFIYKGRTIVEHIYSPGLECNLLGTNSTQAVKVYLPPAYDHFPDNKYPVIYLLHRYWSDYNSYYVSYPDLYNTLNQLISEKVIVPIIVVTPNGSNKYLGSFYTNSYVTGNWEDYIVQDVIGGIEHKFRVLAQRESRGLAGLEMGGYGTAVIGMKHPSLFNAVGIGNADLDFTETCIDGFVRKDLITAARINSFRPGDAPEIHECFARAVAFAPDSNAEPVLGKLPYTADGLLIDSIWQEWLMHDPVTMLQSYSDSLRKLKTIQLFVGENEDNRYQSSKCFHKALLDHGIIHGYELCSDDMLDLLFRFFSEQLVGIVPTVLLSSDYYLEKNDTLVAVTDMSGQHYIVPYSTYPAIDSIHKYRLVTAEAYANRAVNFHLSGFGYGKYRVYTVSNDTAVSNISSEFCVVPDKSRPILRLENNYVLQNDIIQVSMNRYGKICLHIAPFLNIDTLYSASEIINSSRLIASADALAGAEVSFSTNGLMPKPYWIYGFDQYGIVAGPITVTVVKDPTVNSIRMVENLPEFELFPNPADEKITVHSSKPGIYDIEITGQKGQLLYSNRVERTTQRIDLSSLPQGFYIITIRSDNSITTKKIIEL